MKKWFSWGWLIFWCLIFWPGALIYLFLKHTERK